MISFSSKSLSQGVSALPEEKICGARELNEHESPLDWTAGTRLNTTFEF